MKNNQEVWNTFVDVIFAIEKEVLLASAGKDRVETVIDKPKNKRSRAMFDDTKRAWRMLDEIVAFDIIERHIEPYSFISFDRDTELLTVNTGTLNYSIITYNGGISSFICSTEPHKADGKCKAVKPRIKQEDNSGILGYFIENKVSKTENDKRVLLLREWSDIVGRYRRCRKFNEYSVIENVGGILNKDDTSKTMELVEDIREVFKSTPYTDNNSFDKGVFHTPNEILQAIDTNANLVTY